MQHHFSDLASTSYDHYPPALAYSSGSPSYPCAPQLVLEAPKGDARPESKRWTPSGSPSPSVSQPYDQPPSAVSSVSGASGQSTASSAVGSPYSHATQSLPGQEHWTDSHLGLGIAAGTFHNDRFGNDIFPTTNIDQDLMIEDGKYPINFVGKSRNISPSSISASHLNPPAVSPSPPPSQCLISAFHTPRLALDTSMVKHDVTIDTTLEEVNSIIGTPPQSISPASALLTTASPTASRWTQPISFTPHTACPFKAPTTPASAMSSFAPRGFSPPAWHQPHPRRHTTAVCGDVNVQHSPPASSRRTHPYGRPTLPSVPQIHFHNNHSQPPFFSQSSGRYVAPLESSCWFSSIAFLLSDSLSSQTYLFMSLLLIFSDHTIPMLVLLRLTHYCYRSISHSAFRCAHCEQWYHRTLPWNDAYIPPAITDIPASFASTVRCIEPRIASTRVYQDQERNCVSLSSYCTLPAIPTRIGGAQALNSFEFFAEFTGQPTIDQHWI